MGQILLPKQYHPDFATPGKKPIGPVEIDWDNKLTGGLLSYPEIKSGRVYDLVRGSFYTANKAGLEYPPSNGDVGLATTINSTAVSSKTPIFSPGTGDYTIFTRVYIDTVETTFNRYIASLSGSSGVTSISNGAFRFHIAGSNRTGTTIQQEGRVYNVVGVRRAGVGNLYVNGALEASGANTQDLSADYEFVNLAFAKDGTLGDAGNRHLLASGVLNRAWSVAEVLAFNNDPYQLLKSATVQAYNFPSAAAVTSVTAGTSVPTQTEVKYVTGGETTTLELTGDTWVAAGSAFNAVRQAIINGFDSAQLELLGWNKEIRDKEVVTAVVRTSDTVVTITWTAAAAYDITATETITPTIPASALVLSSSSVVSTPTFTVTPVAAPGGIIVLRRRLNGYR